VSSFGSHISGTALPLAALLTLGATPGQMGLLAAVGELPVWIVGLLAGVWVDRLRRRPLLIAADLGRAALIGSVPVAALFGTLTLAQLYVVAALAGVLTVLFNAADQAYLPALVEPDQLVEGNSKLAMSDSLAEIAGPPSGGLLVQWLTAPIAVLFDAISFLLSALSLALIRKVEPPAPPPEARTGVGQEIREGLRVVWHDRVLRALLFSSAMASFFGGAYHTLYSLFLIRDLALSPAVLGAMIGAGGISALIGAALAGRITRRFGIGPSMIASRLIGCTLGLVVPLAGGPPWLVIALLAFSQLTDITWAVFFINEASLLQRRVPDRLLGRASASLAMVGGGMMPIGALLAGVFADGAGARLTLLIGSFGLIASALPLIFSPLRTLRDQH
jgi:MFS family permease